MSSNFPGVPLTAAAILLAVAADAGPATAAVRLCKASISGDERKAPTLAGARAEALKSWQKFAELNGEKFGVWRLATGRLVSCRKLADDNHYCIAKGSPCIVSQTVPPGIGPRSEPRAPTPKGDLRI
jgi:hypothetical protein